MTTTMIHTSIFLVMLAVGIGIEVLFLDADASLIMISAIMAVLFFLGNQVGKATYATEKLSENYAYTIRTGMLRTYHTDDYTLDEDTLEFTDESGTKRIIHSGSFEITENKKNAKKTEEEQNK